MYKQSFNLCEIVLQCYSDVTHKLAKYLADEKLLSIVITDSSVSEYYKEYTHGVAQPGQ